MLVNTFFYPFGSVIITQRFQPYISLLPGSLDANILAVLERESLLLHTASEIIKAVGNSYQFINALPDLLFPRCTTFQIYPFMITVYYRLTDIILTVKRLDSIPLAYFVRQLFYLIKRCLVGRKMPAFEVIDVDLDMIVNLSCIIMSGDHRLHIITKHFFYQIKTYLLRRFNADIVLWVKGLNVMYQLHLCLTAFGHRLVELVIRIILIHLFHIKISIACVGHTIYRNNI